MADPPVVSVIACVYNAEATFGATLDCVFQSDWPVPYEVIVIDDASTDGTPELCRSYDLKLIQLDENAGPAKARNVGIKAASGSIILFVDSDVLFGPNTIRRMLDKMEADPELAGVGTISSPTPLNPNFYSRYFALQEYHILTTAQQYRRSPAAVGICTRLGTIKRAVFEDLGGFNEAIRKPSVEDGEFSLRMRGKYYIDWYAELENRHYFPDSLGKIWRRYHLNTKELSRAMRRLGAKDTGMFREDSTARLLLGLAGIFVVAGVWIPWAWLGAIALAAGAIFVKRELFGLFWRHEGALFCLRSAFVYALTSFPIATGLAAGMLPEADGQNGTSST